MNLLKLLLCFLMLSSCSVDAQKLQKSNWQANSGKLKILSTTGMIHDLVQKIGGDHVDSLTLIKGELDPHSYQLVKGDDQKLASADLIFFNGLGLEHGPSLRYHLENNPRAISLGDRLQKLHPQLILYYNGTLDPHIWMDISLWEKTVPLIVEALSQKSPTHADLFRKNGDNLSRSMHEKHEELKALISQVPEHKRFLVTSHDAFNYFARAYLATAEEREKGGWQKRFAAPEGLAPDSQLSPVDIQLIIDHLKKYQIHIIFPESNISKDSIRKILAAGKEKGLDLKIANVALYADAMGPPGSDGDSYLKMISHNVQAILENITDEQKR